MNILFWTFIVIALSAVYALIPSDKKCKKCGSEKFSYKILKKEKKEHEAKGDSPQYTEIITYEQKLCNECGERRDKKCRKCGEYTHLKTVEILANNDNEGRKKGYEKNSLRECSKCGKKVL